MQFLLPVMFLFYMDNNISIGDFFLFQGIFSLCGFLFEIPIGYISDHFSKKNILIFSFLLLVIKIILWMSFSGYTIILIGEILNSFSRSFYNCNCSSYIYEYLLSIKEKDIKKVMLKKYGNNNSYLSINTAIIALVGSIIYSRYGYIVSLLIELIFICIGIIFLLTLPKIKLNNEDSKDKNIIKEYKNLFYITKNTLKNKTINSYIMLSALFGSSTLVLVNNFQPLMKFTEFPVEMFGIVYFVNYFFRSMSGWFVSSTTKLISIKNITWLTFISFLLSILFFIFSYLVNNQIFTGFSLFLSCIAIFFGLIYYYIDIAKIHDEVSSEQRSVTIGVNEAVSRFLSSFSLMFFKFFSTSVSIKYSLVIYLLVFFILFKLIYGNKNEYKF